ncbi:glucan biosynthesis protein D, partial [Methylobacterium sp. J-026]|nr:glucan biosynthesis protein D [Methylobacterium sp. J-026]
MLAGAVGAAAGSLPGNAIAAGRETAPALPGAGEAFEANTLLDFARARSKAPCAGPKSGDLPAALKDLSRDACEPLRRAAGRANWAARGSGCSFEPLSLRSLFVTRAARFLVDHGLVLPVSSDETLFA